MNTDPPNPGPHSTPLEDQLWCEGCGYRLDGLAGEGRCPECGRLVADSDPERRSGSRWQCSPSVFAWMIVGLSVLLRPRTFWDTVRVERRRSRGLALVNAFVAALVCVGIPAFVLRDTGLFVWLTPFVALVVWTLVLIETVGIRFWGRVHKARVTREVAWAVCGHASVGWVIGAVLVVAGWVVGQFDVAAGGYRVFGAGRAAASLPVVSPALIGAGALFGMLLFETLTYLGVRRMRYANRSAVRDSVSQEFGAEVSR